MCNLKVIKDRLNNLLQCLRNQNSGADIHTVATLRAQCQMLMDVAPDLTDAEIEDMCRRIESDVVKFFTDKYTHLKTPARIRN